MLETTDLESRVSQIESDMGIIQHNLMQVMNWIKEHIRHAETLASKTEADRRFIRNTIDE